MARSNLQFQAPPDWLVQGYVNRPNPVVEGLNSAASVTKAYADSKEQKQKDALAQEDRDIKLAQLNQSGGSNAMDTLNAIRKSRGQPPLSIPATTPTPDTQAPPQDPSQPNFQPDSGASAQAVAPSGSPVVSHWNSSMGGGPTPPTGKPTAPEVGSDPAIQEFEQLGSSGYRKKYGDNGLAKVKQALDIQKGLQDKTKGPLQTLTKEQALKDGTFDPSKQIMVEPPAPRLDLSTKQDQFDQKEWDKIVKDTNPLTASSRSTLGMASKANYQADRALVTLSKPVVTNQEAGNVMADIAAIYQTGSPTQYGMSHQEYSTLYGKIKGALQTVTGNPQDALPDEIKQRLVGVLHEMKGTNGLVLKQQLDYTEKAKAKVISKFPQEWKDIRSTLESNPDQETAIPTSGPHGPSVSQNGHLYNWNANSGKYE